MMARRALALSLLTLAGAGRIETTPLPVLVPPHGDIVLDIVRDDGTVVIDEPPVPLPATVPLSVDPMPLTIAPPVFLPIPEPATATTAPDDMLRKARLLVLSRHRTEFDAAEVPQASLGALATWLQTVDPHAYLDTPDDIAGAARAPLARFGIVAVETAQGTLFKPVENGPAWRAGWHGPARYAPDPAMPADRAALERALLDSESGGPPVPLRLLDDGPLEVRPRRDPDWRMPDFVLVETPTVPILRLYRIIGGQTAARLQAVLSRGMAGRSGKRWQMALDLRYAPGGNIDEAMKIASLMLPPGMATGSVLTRSGVRAYTSAKAPKLAVRANHVAVFAGPATASAAEALLVALREGGAQVFGGRTHGKCAVQTVFPLEPGTVFAFSTGTLRQPDGAPCEGGYDPDIAVREVAMLHDDPAMLDRLAPPDPPALASVPLRVCLDLPGMSKERIPDLLHHWGAVGEPAWEWTADNHTLCYALPKASTAQRAILGRAGAIPDPADTAR